MATFTRAGLLFAAFLAAAIGAATPAAAQAMIEGTWRSGNASEITIKPCPEGFCGAISKPAVSGADLAQYGDAETAMKSFVDEYNEDKSLRTRPLLGLAILHVNATDNPWHFEGQVYNPSDGKTYSGEINVTGADTLLLKGCAAYVFCNEDKWTRVVD